MIDSITRITLNLQETNTVVSIRAKRGDTGRKLLIHLSDGSIPYHISDECYATFTAKKADGTKINNPCSIENNVIIYEFTEQTCTAVGTMKAEIRLYGSDDKMITSACFLVNVYDTVFRDGDEVDSESEMNTLDDLILRANAFLNETGKLLRWQGNWDSETEYEANDLVLHEEVLYVAEEAIAAGTAPGSEEIAAWVPIAGMGTGTGGGADITEQIKQAETAAAAAESSASAAKTSATTAQSAAAAASSSVSIAHSSASQAQSAATQAQSAATQAQSAASNASANSLIARSSSSSASASASTASAAATRAEEAATRAEEAAANAGNGSGGNVDVHIGPDKPTNGAMYWLDTSEDEPIIPDVPVEPDVPDEPEIVTYTITNNLTNVTNGNSATSVEENASYTATLTAADGYELDAVTVTMGGTDVTATVYANGVVTISAVTGNVVITATAKTTGDVTDITSFILDEPYLTCLKDVAINNNGENFDNSARANIPMICSGPTTSSAVLVPITDFFNSNYDALYPVCYYPNRSDTYGACTGWNVMVSSGDYSVQKSIASGTVTKTQTSDYKCAAWKGFSKSAVISAVEGTEYTIEDVTSIYFYHSNVGAKNFDMQVVWMATEPTMEQLEAIRDFFANGGSIDSDEPETPDEGGIFKLAEIATETTEGVNASGNAKNGFTRYKIENIKTGDIVRLAGANAENTYGWYDGTTGHSLNDTSWFTSAFQDNYGWKQYTWIADKDYEYLYFASMTSKLESYPNSAATLERGVS